MTPAFFEKDTDYILSRTTIEARIAAIDAIIDALFVQQLALASQGEPITEYMLNDGQTIIKAIYKTPEAIARTIELMQKQRNRYANMGRNTYRLVGERNFIGPRSNT